MMVTVDQAIKYVMNAMARVGYDVHVLPYPLQVVELINQVDCEVSMGGVFGWLSNVGGLGPDAAQAFDAIGARECAAIVREILSVFPGGAPALDDQERAVQLDEMSDETVASWRDLGLRLLTWPGGVRDLLQRFIDEHQEAFPETAAE